MALARSWKLTITTALALFLIVVFYEINTYLQGFRISSFDKEDVDRLMAPEASYTLVTATTEHQFCNVKSLVYQFRELLTESLKEARIKAAEVGNKERISRPRLIIYDIGLNRDQQNFFKALKKNRFIDDVVEFDFSSKPAFWNPQKSRGQYAWRPGIIHNATQTGHGHIVVWVSPEISLTRGFMDSIPGLAEHNGGFVGAKSNAGNLRISEKGRVGTTHAGLFSYYKDTNPGQYKDVPMCSALAMAFAPGRGFQLLKDWLKCASNSKCIAPRGSNRRNHGFDLSALTYLAHKGNFLDCDREPEMLGVTLQPPDPIECNDRMEEIEAELAKTSKWLDRIRTGKTI